MATLVVMDTFAQMVGTTDDDDDDESNLWRSIEYSFVTY